MIPVFTGLLHAQDGAGGHGQSSRTSFFSQDRSSAACGVCTVGNLLNALGHSFESTRAVESAFSRAMGRRSEIDFYDLDLFKHVGKLLSADQSSKNPQAQNYSLKVVIPEDCSESLRANYSNEITQWGSLNYDDLQQEVQGNRVLALVGVQAHQYRGIVLDGNTWIDFSSNLNTPEITRASLEQVTTDLSSNGDRSHVRPFLVLIKN